MQLLLFLLNCLYLDLPVFSLSFYLFFPSTGRKEWVKIRVVFLLAGVNLAQFWNSIYKQKFSLENVNCKTIKIHTSVDHVWFRKVNESNTMHFFRKQLIFDLQGLFWRCGPLVFSSRTEITNSKYENCQCKIFVVFNYLSEE